MQFLLDCDQVRNLQPIDLAGFRRWKKRSVDVDPFASPLMDPLGGAAMSRKRHHWKVDGARHPLCGRLSKKLLLL